MEQESKEVKALELVCALKIFVSPALRKCSKSLQPPARARTAAATAAAAVALHSAYTFFAYGASLYVHAKSLHNSTIECSDRFLATGRTVVDGRPPLPFPPSGHCCRCGLVQCAGRLAESERTAEGARQKLEWANAERERLEAETTLLCEKQGTGKVGRCAIDGLSTARVE